MKTLPQLFDWPSRHHVHVALPLMLVVSFLLHASGVIVFQSAPIRSQASPERSATVWYLPPGSPAAAKALPMLEAGDPALFSPGHLSARDLVARPETAYQPSFDVESPVLSAFPQRAERSLPAVVPALAAVETAPIRRSPPRSRPGLSTRLRMGSELANREVYPPANASYSAQPKQGLLPLEFLVAVAPEGRLLHFFPQNSSGNESLDREAMDVLARTRFSPLSRGTEPAWGTVTFHWGADVKRDKAP